MSVGDSVEEFILMHALGREGLLVLSSGSSSYPLKILFFGRWETIESFFLYIELFLYIEFFRIYESFFSCGSFLHTSGQICRSLMGARHASPTVE